MEDKYLDLESILEQEESPEYGLDQEMPEDPYKLESEDQYIFDPNLVEIEEAIQRVIDTPAEPENSIKVVEGPEVIELPDNQPEIIEKPRCRWSYGPWCR